jgi:hypothetical protein
MVYPFLNQMFDFIRLYPSDYFCETRRVQSGLATQTPESGVVLAATTLQLQK